MSEFGGGRSEVNNNEIKSSDIKETPSAETGGNASEATKDATNEQANKSGGFDDGHHTESEKSFRDRIKVDTPIKTPEGGEDYLKERNASDKANEEYPDRKSWELTPEKLAEVQAGQQEIAKRYSAAEHDLEGTFSEDFEPLEETDEEDGDLSQLDDESQSGGFDDMDGTEENTENSGDSEKEDFLGFSKKYKDPNHEWNAERRDNINKNVLPKADAEMKQYVKDNGLDAYISDEKLEAKVTDNTKALTPTEMQKQYGKGWNPSIMGFNDGSKSYVDSSFGPTQAKETAVHENFHQMSANDMKDENGKTVYRRGVSINGEDRGFNEALTQKYTLDTMRTTDSTYTNPYCAYDDATTRIDDLYSFSNNKEMFDQAYFQNNPNALKEHFDSYCGDGFYDEMSDAFDVATDNTQTVDAKNEALSKIDSCISQYKCSRYERGDI